LKLVVSLRLKRSVWQDKIFSAKVLIEALTGQCIIDVNILSPTLFEIFLPADQRDAMATILRQGGHLHETPQALTVKDIKRRAAIYNRSHDDLMRAALIPVTRQAVVHQAITKDQDMPVALVTTLHLSSAIDLRLLLPRFHCTIFLT
jgi:hypothetical protein